jgi:hypothetical protein
LERPLAEVQITEDANSAFFVTQCFTWPPKVSNPFKGKLLICIIKLIFVITFAFCFFV